MRSPNDIHAKARSSTVARSKRAQGGATLLEVLIAVIIMAIGMLGVAAMQTVSLRNSQSSFERTQAVVLTYSILDAMRANPGAARTGGYNMSMRDIGTPATGTGATTIDRNQWLQSLAETMGASAKGQIACTGEICVVTVQWDDSRATGDGGEDTVVGRTAQQVVTRTRI